MRSLWKGAISFGLVNIPVKLYAATESKDVHFHLLHGVCHTRIRNRRYCPACDRPVENEELARGYEYGPDEYVPVEPADLENLPLATGKAVQILDFVNLDEIDPIHFEKSYFLEPADGGGRAYALLREAMERTGRVALAKVALRAKESLATVRVYGRERSPDNPSGRSPDGFLNGHPGNGAAGAPDGGRGILVLETMYYPDEVRSFAQLEAGNLPAEVPEREMAMAVNLVDGLTVPFEPERYHDEYREALQRMIEEKARGRRVVASEAAEPARVIDLMTALEESVRLAEERRKRGAAGTSEERAAGDRPPQWVYPR